MFCKLSISAQKGSIIMIGFVVGVFLLISLVCVLTLIGAGQVHAISAEQMAAERAKEKAQNDETGVSSQQFALTS